MITPWIASDWLRDFHAAAKTAHHNELHRLRALVFEDTRARVAAEPALLSPPESTLYEHPPRVAGRGAFVPAFTVVGADGVEVATALSRAGSKPLLLNMANRHNPGGGVLGGAGAQEENLFRRSNLFASLYPFADYAAQYGLVRSRQGSYPLNQDRGGVYTPEATFFRSGEATGYALAGHPERLAVVSVAAVSHPQLERRGDRLRLAPLERDHVAERMRGLLRIAAAHGHSTLVLSAFGCGAFANPPDDVAELFAQVFSEKEFLGCFDHVVFAILEDHNAFREHNPEGNLLPFVRRFG